MKKNLLLIVLGWQLFSNLNLNAQSCTVNAGVDQRICITSPLTLTGIAGIPKSDPPVYQWTKLSGPAATITSPTTEVTTVTGFTVGNYVFQLTSKCADGILAKDIVAVKVLPEPPAALAGPDLTQCLNTPGVQLAANAVALPLVGTWTVTPFGGTFSPNINAPNAVYTPPAGANTYTLTWTISNGKCTKSDQMLLNIVSPVTPVFAGPDINLTCGGNCITMAGSSPGLIPPSGGFWSLVSGPNTPVIVDPTNAGTQVCGLIPGSYTLKWTVAGACGGGFDEMNIVVNDIFDPPVPQSDILYPSTCVPPVVSGAVLTGIPLTAGETGVWVQTVGTGAIFFPSNTVASPAISNLSEGTNTFVFTRTNTSGCNASSGHTITVNEPIQNLIISPAQELACDVTTTNFNVTFEDNANLSNLVRNAIRVSGPGTLGEIAFSSSSSLSGNTTDIWTVTGLTRAGTYVFRVEYLTACGTQFKTIAITTSVTPGAVNAGSDPLLPCNFLTANPIGSVDAPGVYTWSQVSGPNTATLSGVNTLSLLMTNLVAGVYNMQLSLSGGKACPSLNDFMVVRIVTDLPPVATVGASATVCAGSFPLTANTPRATDTGVWTVSPSSGVSFLPNASTPNAIVTGLQPFTDYTFTWTISNSCGSKSAQQVLTTSGLVGPPLPNAGIDMCLPAGTTSFALTGNNPGTSNIISWTALDAGSSVSPSNTQNTTASFSTPGTYRFVYLLGVTGCTSLTDTVKIAINQNAAADAGADFDFCASTLPATITLTAAAPPAGTTGKWSKLSGPASITINTPTNNITTVSGLLPGIYEFEYRISFGGICPDLIDKVVVRVTAEPSAANAGPDQSVCNVMASTLLTMAANTPLVGTGFWTVVSGPTGSTPLFLDDTSPTSTITNLSNGVYTLRWTITSGPGCPDKFDDLVLNITVTANAGTDFNLCNTPSTLLTGNANTTGTWAFVSGTAGSTITTISPNLAVVSNLIAPGTYTYSYSLPAVGTCPATIDEVTFINFPAPSQSVAPADVSLCPDVNTITLTGNIPTSGIGTWVYISGPSPAPTLSGVSPDVTLTTITPGLHVLQYQVNTTPECVASTDNVFVIKEGPAIAGSDINVCNSTSVSLNATPGVVNAGTWSYISGPAGSSFTDVNTPNTAVNGLVPGTYVFRWTLGSGGVCLSSFDEITVIIDGPVTGLNAGADVILCEGTVGSPILLGSPAIPGVTYLWTPDVLIDDATLAQPTFIGTGSAGTYVYTVKGTNGTCVAFDAVNVTVNPKPFPVIDFTLLSATCGVSLIGNNELDLGNITDIYAWNFGAGASPATSNIVGPINVTYPPNSGVHTVTLTITSADGCSATVTQEIQNLCVVISGNVFNDVNGNTNSLVDGVAVPTPSGTQLYANLLSTDGSTVIATVPIAVDGSYSFPANININYQVQISINQGVVGNATPATALPLTWVNTGETTGAANPSTGNDGLQTVAVLTIDVPQVNFGIEQPPIPVGGIAPSVVNPGGTTQSADAASLFTSSDPSGGVVTNLIITSFPTGATSIFVGGMQYTAGTFPSGGISVPVDPITGLPTVPITADPAALGTTDVVFTFVAVDNAGKQSTTSATVTLPFTGLDLAGTVYNDVSGIAVGSVTDGTGIGSPSGTPLYANLLSADGLAVLATVPVNANGTYLFDVSANTGYIVQITTNQGTVGGATPVTALPAGWVNTGDIIPGGTATTATPGLSDLVNVVLNNVTLVDFGIQQIPTPVSNTAPIVVNPGGTTQSADAASLFSGTDPSGGTIASLTITAFPTGATSISINNVVYTTLAAIQADYPNGIPTTTTGAPTVPITVDPSGLGATSVVIPYIVTDNAGAVSTITATITIPFSGLNLAGTVYNDVTGISTGGVTDGAGIGLPSGTQLYANLLSADGATVLATVPVNANGTYQFNVSANSGYIVQITTNQGVVNSPTPATALPTDWVNTGDIIPGGIATTATPGLSDVVNVVLSNVTLVDFGIEQPPTPVGMNAVAVPNPEGTVQSANAASLFSGTDPSGGTIASLTLTSFPTGATSIVVGGVTYLATDPFPVGGIVIPTNAAGVPTVPITADPAALGTTSVVFTFVVTDNAGIVSPTSATVTLPFIITLAGTVYNDVSGIAVSSVTDGTGIGLPSGIPLYANLLNAAGTTVLATMPLNANGTYVFPVTDNTSYIVQITTNQGTVGGATPVTALPAGWVNTGDIIPGGTATTATPGLSDLVNVVLNNVTLVDFGIQQIPTPVSNTAPIVVNPGGTTQSADAASLFSGTDPSGGTIASLTITAFPTGATSISINNVVYTTLAAIQADYPNGIPTTTTGAPTVPITVDPSGLGATSVVIPYIVTDNAGAVSTITATITIPFSGLNLAGTVYNDVTGISTGGVTDGAGIGLPSGTQLYANLLSADGATVLATVPVNANGTYQFNVSANSGYIVQITTNQGVVNSPTPATALPTDWVNTGDIIPGGIATTATPGLSDVVNVVLSNVTLVDFGIEQPPTPVGMNAVAVPNPEGTVQSANAASLFSGTDPSGGTIASLTLTSFPTGATSIVVGGVTYLATDPFPVGGIVIPTNAAGVPTVPITADPAALGTTSVVFTFVVTDNAGIVSPTSATVTLPFIITLAGTVYNDVSGIAVSSVTDGTGIGLPSGIPLYANLLNAAGTTVLAIMPLNANGTYVFPVTDNTSYIVQITTNQGTVGGATPVTALPAGWVNTGDIIPGGTATTATPGLSDLVNVVLNNVTLVDFGIQQIPTPVSNTAPIVVNPGGTTQSADAASLFSGTDPSGGTIASLTITAFPTGATSISINNVVYTTLAAIQADYPNGIPTTTTGAPTVPITVDPSGLGATSVVIPFIVTDNAGAVSTITATITIPFSGLNLAGTVYNDVTGISTGGVTDGAGIGLPSGTQLYANLLSADGATVLATVPLNANGTYQFNVSANSGYIVQITTNQGVVNSPTPATALPTDWVNTGDIIPGGIATTATPGLSDVVNVVLSNVTLVDFGIEQPPTPVGMNAVAVPNPEGTVQSANAASLFSGTDPSGGTIASLTLTSFPTGATSIVVGGVTYLATDPFPVGGIVIPTNAAGVPTVPITADPAALGTTSVVFTFVVTDNAGIVSPTSATVTLPFIITLAGTVYNDVSGIAVSSVTDGTGIGLPSGIPLYANLLNAAGTTVLATMPLNANGTYVFPVTDNTSYIVQITTNQGTVGGATPVTALPAGWVNTGDIIPGGTATTATPGLSDLVNVVLNNVTLVDFGIQQIPTPVSNTAPIVVNPGGTTQSADAASLFSGTDPSGGTIASLTITAFPTGATSISINNVVYTTLAAIQADYPNGIPTTTTGAPTVPITVDPSGLGATSVVIPYIVTDNAGAVSTITATITIPFSGLNLAGTVYNDVTGISTGGVTDGAGIGLPSGTQLYANLLSADGATVLATVPVNANGTYQFNVSANSGYIVQITTNQGVVNSPTPATALPTDWVNTGDIIPGGIATTATPGLSDVVNVVLSNVTLVDFGIEQPPTANTFTYPDETNPGGTISKDITLAFGGTDPTTNTITSLTITEFPANATSITIDGVIYTTLAAIQAVYPNGIPTNALGVPTVPILVDPKSGPTTVSIPYTVTDAAGLISAPGFVEIPFITPANILISGTIFNDINAGNVNSPNAINTIPSGINAYLIENGVIVAVVPVTTLGLYSFPGIKAGTYTVVISTTIAAISDVQPAVTLPTGWVNTGDFIGLPNTGTNPLSINGISEPIDAQNVDIPNVNFGIEQLPTPVGATATAVVNPGGTTQSANATSLFSGNDPSGGTIVSLTITSFPSNASSIVVGGMTYLAIDPIWPSNGGAGIVVQTSSSGVPTVAITVDPVDGSVNVSIPFVVTDNAGFTSTTMANAVLQFSAPLPINLQSFSGNQLDETIVLNWKTTNEVAFSHFEVQKSLDSKEFGNMATVIGNNLGFYNLVDKNPNMGINYYRLKMVDLDGTFTFSKIISIFYENNRTFVSVENPAVNGEFKIFTNQKNAKYSLLSALGQRVDIILARTSDEILCIKVQNPIPGIYYFMVINEGKLITKKIIIP